MHAGICASARVCMLTGRQAGDNNKICELRRGIVLATMNLSDVGNAGIMEYHARALADE